MKVRKFFKTLLRSQSGKKYLWVSITLTTHPPGGGHYPPPLFNLKKWIWLEKHKLRITFELGNFPFKVVFGGNMKFCIIILMIMTVFSCEAEYSYNPIIPDEPSISQNHPPEIIQITANPQNSILTYNDQHEGSTTPVILSVFAIDKDGDFLSYDWYSEFGRFENTGNWNRARTKLTTWNPPNYGGAWGIECTVSDGIDTDIRRITIEAVTQ
jgi:hypothetical protein